MAGAPRCASGATSGPTRNGATSPSMRSRSAPTGRCTTTSADWRISRRIASSSSASRRRASARTTCASCASSASTPPTGKARSIRPASRRRSRSASGLAMLSRERVRAELLKLVAARRAVEVVHALADSGFAQRFLGGVVELGRFARAVGFEHEEGGHPDPVHRLAALAVMVAEDADRLRDLLRLSGAEHARLAAYAGVLARMKSRAERARRRRRPALRRRGRDRDRSRRPHRDRGRAAPAPHRRRARGLPPVRGRRGGGAAVPAERRRPRPPRHRQGPGGRPPARPRPRGLARRGLPARRGRDGALPCDRARTPNST